MAAVARGFRRYFLNQSSVLGSLTRRKHESVQAVRTSSTGQNPNESQNDYEYEISFNPSEWKYVERLMPLRTVPPVSKKEVYPSGWRPQTEEALAHPYYLERTKNHMLPVYLDNYGIRKERKATTVKRIRGDIWLLHEELKQHLETTLNKHILSCVHEGNSLIKFKGDVVYYCEQWLLKKGF